ncbi:MAG TPA: phosphate--AMP phosphotransferase, partial [Acinetobacter nosocomialis]|nr:phosphate--AMP phosphotransferase [Acinetobacter nosocomialis]
MSEQQPKFEIRDEEQLSVDLIEAQYALKDSRGKKNAKSTLILMSGIELAGKGEAVKQLREWLDPRYLRVKADAPRVLTDTEAFWQSYSEFIPTEGQIVVMFGNWYSDLLVTATHVSEPLDEARFNAYVEN